MANDIKLGIVGEAMRAKIKQKNKLLTKEEQDYLESIGYVPRGSGYASTETNKFVSDKEIEEKRAEYRGAQAIPIIEKKESADQVFNIVKSIQGSISAFTDLIIDRSQAPIEPLQPETVAERVPEPKAEEIPIFKKFKALIAIGTGFLLQVAYPIYEFIKAGFAKLGEFIGKLQGMFQDDVMPFFTNTIPNFFDDIKDFFIVSIPKYFNDFIDTAKNALQSLLDIPQRIINSLQDYGNTFSKSILDRFGPWLEMLGVNTEAAANDIKAREKAVKDKELAINNQQKIRDADLARKRKESDDAKKKFDEQKAKQRSIEQAKLEQDKKEREAKRVVTTAAPVTAAPVVAAPTVAPAVAVAKPTPPPAVAAPAPAPQAAPTAPVAVSKKVKSLDAVTEKAGKAVDTSSLKSTLKDKVAAAATDYEEKTGKKLLITSGFRSNEEQNRLWQEKLSQFGGNVAETRKRVAEPAPPFGNGRGSRHSKGEAIDINSKGPNGINVLAGSRDRSTGWLESFGLSRPVNNEDWHVQLSKSEGTPDNPDNPGAPILVPGSTILLADGVAKDVTSKDPGAKAKSGAKGATPQPVATKVDEKLMLPDKPVADALSSASNRVGVELPILYAIAKQESGFDASAKAKGTSATGLFQFVNNTWSGILKEYSGKYPELLKGASDPLANAIAGALYIKENIASLKRKNIPINATSVYAAHFLGPSGARKLFSTSENSIAAVALPSAAASNKNIFYDIPNGNKPRTIGEVIQLLYGKVGKYGEKYAVALGVGTGVQLATATQAADIKAPKARPIATVAAAPTTAPAIKTAALGKDSIPAVAAVIKQYKSYFSVA